MGIIALNFGGVPFTFLNHASDDFHLQTSDCLLRKYSPLASVLTNSTALCLSSTFFASLKEPSNNLIDILHHVDTHPKHVSSVRRRSWTRTGTDSSEIHSRKRQSTRGQYEQRFTSHGSASISRVLMAGRYLECYDMRLLTSSGTFTTSHLRSSTSR